mmetsp:Transcript_8449/g.9288  ORF Transcript_8449/g.9288 Transcript_8449/m.9288 type:complete len:391 (-) Transcript_8449:28-1200(-)
MDKSSFSVVKKLVPPPSNTDTFTTSLDDEERTVCYTYPTETGDDSQFIKSPIREEFDFSYFCYTSDEEDSSSQQSDLGGNSHIHEGDNVLKTSRVNNVRVEHEQSCHVSNNRKITKEIIYIDSDESDDDDDDDEDEGEKRYKKYKISKKDPLYNPNEDDEDEAYVYKHLRGGIEEYVSVQKQNTQNKDDIGTGKNSTATSSAHGSNKGNTDNITTSLSSQTQTQNQRYLEQVKMLKPRTSDGILSCPCCFTIVCMDCQKHEKYSNQYRAMFVMNIGVDWDVTISPENHKNTNTNNTNTNNSNKKTKLTKTTTKSVNSEKIDAVINTNVKLIPTYDDDDNDDDNMKKMDDNNKEVDDDIYYSVKCIHCRTEVAGLDMRDEVYHFFGCIVSG